MERVSKSWEDDFLLLDAPTAPCINQLSCKGHTARTVHGRSLGHTLKSFRLPSGRAFARCLLCLRAETSQKWYDALWSKDAPPSPIHDWAVEVDKADQYDSACCIGPAGDDAYVGVQGPFPRYDETVLLVLPEKGFRQLCVHYAEIPRLLKPSERAGARPLGWHDLFRTQFALIFAGYTLSYTPRVREKTMPLAALYARCVPGTNVAAAVGAKWLLDAKRDLANWLPAVLEASVKGLYPHCLERTQEPVDHENFNARAVTLCVREHMSFLVERDSPELQNAVRRAFPVWDAFVDEVRASCDAMRKSLWKSQVPLLAAKKRGAIKTHDEIVLFQYRDLVCGEPLAEPVYWYVCTTCGEFKFDTARGGCKNVCVDLDTGEVHCYKKRAVGRRPTLKALQKDPEQEFVQQWGCFGPVRGLWFGERLVLVRGVAHFPCVRCSKTSVCLDWRGISRGLVCEQCCRPQESWACEVCGVKCAEDGFHIQAFCAAKGLRAVYFCKNHLKHRLKLHAEVWSYDLLMEAASEVVTQKRRRR
jgi:hypothetical protein